MVDPNDVPDEYSLAETVVTDTLVGGELLLEVWSNSSRETVWVLVVTENKGKGAQYTAVSDEMAATLIRVMNGSGEVHLDG